MRCTQGDGGKRVPHAKEFFSLVAFAFSLRRVAPSASPSETALYLLLVNIEPHLTTWIAFQYQTGDRWLKRCGDNSEHFVFEARLYLAGHEPWQGIPAKDATAPHLLAHRKMLSLATPSEAVLPKSIV